MHDRVVHLSNAECTQGGQLVMPPSDRASNLGYLQLHLTDPSQQASQSHDTREPHPLSAKT